MFSENSCLIPNIQFSDEKLPDIKLSPVAEQEGWMDVLLANKCCVLLIHIADEVLNVVGDFYSLP